MTTPTPSTEERVAALEAAAVQLQDRLTVLEERMVAGLEELKARRPPVRRRLDELEERLAEVLPPANEGSTV